MGLGDPEDQVDATTDNPPRMVANIRSASDSSLPHELTAMGGKLYFTANNGNDGYELWVYDPSKDVESGVNPIMVDNIRSESDSSYPEYLTAIGGKLYFTANNGVNGHELWFYDPSKVVTQVKIQEF